MTMQKDEYFRSREFLDLAKGQQCQICGAEDGTVISAHSDQSEHGKGMGIKAHDCFIAWTCYKCHLMLGDGSLTRETRDELWNRAHIRTLPKAMALWAAKRRGR